MTGLTARSWLDKRLNRQYNQDADGQQLLDAWLNAACRWCWEWMPLGFNETSIATGDSNWPTISSDQFTLPTAAISLLELKKSTGSGSSNYEDDVNFHQSGRIIYIRDTGVVPTRMVYHSFYTDLNMASESISSYLPDYLVIEMAAYLGVGETRNPEDHSPVVINKTMEFLQNWARKFSIRREGASQPFTQDGRRLDRQNNIYSPGAKGEGMDTYSKPFTVGR